MTGGASRRAALTLVTLDGRRVAPAPPTSELPESKTRTAFGNRLQELRRSELVLSLGLQQRED